MLSVHHSFTGNQSTLILKSPFVCFISLVFWVLVLLILVGLLWGWLSSNLFFSSFFFLIIIFMFYGMFFFLKFRTGVYISEFKKIIPHLLNTKAFT